MDQHAPAVPDREELRAHIGAAATPALLMLVAHITDDPSVLREKWRPNTAQLPYGGLGAAVDAQIRDYCLARLEPLLPDATEWPSAPSERVLNAIGAWSLGAQASQVGDLLREAFVAQGTDRRAPDWSLAELDPARDLRVAIIGTGIAGLLAGLRMKQAGIPFVIYEKAAEIGGTWAENTYPDCRTDVHSHIYSYSFFAWEWPSYFSRQEVILDYLRAFAEHHGLLESVRFNTEVTGATWDEAGHHWSVRTIRDGERSEVDVDVLISAVGQLNRPVIPSIEGLETFGGPSFHSADWDHSADLTGKRVAVVGTGASALQFAPATARVAQQMTIFQRSAPWLMPTPELRQDIGGDERWLFGSLPHYRAYYRFSIFLPRAIGQLAAATVDPGYPPTERAASAANEELRARLTSYLVDQAGSDEELLGKIVPDYPPGAKRIIRDDGTWVSTLKRDNVRLVSDQIERIDETGIWTEAGEHVEVDVILFGTGFSASDFLTPMTVTGIGGKDLHETWGIDACAYMGITVPEFPNLFCLYGPNTNLVLHGNLVFFMECQAAYVLSALRVLIATGKSAMSLRKDVMDDYQDEVTRASALRVWGWSKTHSWYQNAEGRSTIMWPLSAQRYLDGTRATSPDHYDFS
ncbi:MAG: flavin-containing monooxygenase [Sciscionella sp.]